VGGVAELGHVVLDVGVLAGSKFWSAVVLVLDEEQSRLGHRTIQLARRRPQ
jgi:hypothetical protein